MGYACPVCDAPQADGEHLANHLAFTAMLHGDEHEAFLDDHVPDWADRTPGELSAALIHHADQVEYDEVFEDTTAGAGMGRSGPEPGGGPRPGRPDVDAAPSSGGPVDGTVDEEARRAIEEARKLFERGGDPDGGDEAAADGDADPADGGDDAGDAAGGEDADDEGA